MSLASASIYIVWGASVAGFTVLWNLIGGYITPYLPPNISTIINESNKDIASSALHAFWIGLGSAAIYSYIVRGNSLLNNVGIIA